jgi:SAM-dependent methyltransferase
MTPSDARPAAGAGSGAPGPSSGSPDRTIAGATAASAPVAREAAAPGAAERFYARNHRLHEDANLGKTPKTTGQVLADLAQPRHRYFCVNEHLRANPGLSVVELGFGSPDIAQALSTVAAAYRIVDVVPRHRGTSLPANVDFTKADLNEDFPFADGAFDCTVAMMVVEHLFDPFHSFREIARITRPGGRIFVNLPNVASVRCRLQLACGRMPNTSSADWFEKEEWDGNHLHYFTVRDTLRLARHVGLTPLAHYPVGNLLWLKRLAPGFFCHEISFAFLRP